MEFLHPQPDEAALAAIYSRDYFLGADDQAAMARRSEMKRATAARYIATLAILAGPAPGALLEAGCGHGEALAEARRRGFGIAGCELSPHAAALANQSLGETVVCAGSLDAVHSPQFFAAVLAADVIEHVRDPLAFLERARELLRPGGVLLLVTPSLDSWTRRLLRRCWMEYKIEHLFYFSAPGMRRMLQQTGFDDIQIVPNRKVLTIDYLWRHFQRFRVPLLSPILDWVRRLLPDRLAHCHWLLPAGGMQVTARKRSAPPPRPGSLPAAGSLPAKDGAPATDTAR